MTREEALARMPNAIRCNNQMSDGELIDRLSALGILKLDEPKSALRKLMDDLADHSMHPSHLPATLQRLGLKIIEK